MDKFELVDLTKISVAECFGGGILGHFKAFKYKYYKNTWLSFRLSRLFWRIHDFFCPKQSWVMDGVPKRWQDKPELLMTVMFNFIKHYVEGEKAIESIAWNCDEGKECQKFIIDCYTFITVERPARQAAIENIIHKAHVPLGQWMNDKRTYEEKYPNLDRLEKELEDLETFFLNGIVKYRQYLWT